MADVTQCSWCGLVHPGKCPEVKSIEYFEGGPVKRVEFFSLHEKLGLPQVTVSSVFVPPYQPPALPPISKPFALGL